NTLTTYLSPGGTLGNIISSQPGLLLTFSNTFPFVIRLLGKDSFHLYPYSSLYSSLTIESISSWTWPILVLVVPVVAVFVKGPRFLSWKVVIVAEVIAWATIAWSDGPNPPFGLVVGPIMQAYPPLRYAFPYYYVEYQILAVVYPVLAALSVVWLALGLRGLLQYLEGGSEPSLTSQVGPAKSPVSTTGRRSGASSLPSMGSKIFAISLAALLMLVVMPVYDGQALSPRATLAPGGFDIPPEYLGLRQELASVSGNTLLLPGVHTYVQTSWGYYGASSFYTIYNYPSQVIQPDFYGPFQITNQSINQGYDNLTEPLVPADPIPSNELSLFNLTPHVNTAGGTLTLSWPTLKHPTHAFLTAAWIGINLTATDSNLFKQQIGNGVVSVGITSLNATTHLQQAAWFTLGAAYNSQVTNLSGGEVEGVVLPSFPDKGAINLANVTALDVRVGEFTNASQLGLSLVGAECWADSGISASWNSALQSHQVTDILTDATLIGGLLAPQGYASLCIAQLLKNGEVTLSWQSRDLDLYRITIA
ncbi:MAG: hypothetical protein WBX00_23705, partial [Isosphaeraceae bacterium]